MNTFRKSVNKAAYLMLATGLVATPIAGLAQQKAVEEYNQYLTHQRQPVQVGHGNPGLRAAIVRLDARVKRLASQQERFVSNGTGSAGGHVGSDTDQRNTVSVNHTRY